MPPFTKVLRRLGKSSLLGRKEVMSKKQRRTPFTTGSGTQNSYSARLNTVTINQCANSIRSLRLYSVGSWWKFPEIMTPSSQGEWVMIQSLRYETYSLTNFGWYPTCRAAALALLMGTLLRQSLAPAIGTSNFRNVGAPVESLHATNFIMLDTASTATVPHPWNE